MSREIQLTKGRVAIVDDADFEWLSRWRWCSDSAGYAVRTQLAGTRKGRRKQNSIYMARLIMNPPEGMEIDHINRKKADNRRANLRICTHQQNVFNRRARDGHYKGVYEAKVTQTKKKRWVAMIKRDGKPERLGTFSNPEDAARAYDKAAIRLFGDFAYLNFPKVLHDE